MTTNTQASLNLLPAVPNTRPFYARLTALGQRLLCRGCGSQCRGDARYYFNFDAMTFQGAQFFIGAAEQHRIAALQAYHQRMLAGVVD